MSTENESKTELAAAFAQDPQFGEKGHNSIDCPANR